MQLDIIAVYQFRSSNIFLWFFTRLLALFSILFLVGCESNEYKKTFIIGFSQCTGGDAWRKAMNEEMKREDVLRPDIKLLIKDAKGDNTTQIQHINEFIDQKVDLLIVSPNESKPITPIVERVMEADIPVIVIDRKTNSNLYSSYIGASNEEIGAIAGKYVAQTLGKKGRILEIWGLEGSSPAIERHAGFKQAISFYSEIQIVGKVIGNWERNIAKRQLRTIADSLESIDLIFAHNDVMALGAYEVCKELGIEEKIKFLGVDGLQGPTGGLQLVEDEILDATFLYPTGGQRAIEVATQILKNEPFNKEYLLSTTVIDKSNVSIMKSQIEKLVDQHEDIERLQVLADRSMQIYQNQTILVYVLIATLIFAFILSAYTYLSLKEKQESNQILAQKNKEISNQKDQIVVIAEQAEKATQAKFRFFTNISHEFRTPLTLILASVEELIAKEISYQKDLGLIRKNALRLLRLINQLMDFRKIENNKMVVQASKQDLVLFTKDIMSAFDKLAKQRHIDYQLLTNKPELFLWFDGNMLDKVLFNLLSNAFKFTDPNGTIKVLLEESPLQKKVSIKVEDNGRGMSPEHAANAFKRFYQGENYRTMGTGLGLSLSKEIIQLHKGQIEVLSEKGKGTRFTIDLPIGKAHFAESELKKIQTTVSSDNYKNYTIFVEEDTSLDAVKSSSEKEYTLLVVEDNAELRQFIVQKLSKDYNVFEAKDGEEGIMTAVEIIPDLVISDLMLPNKDGIEVAKTLKSDLRTSHIPIIMLTAENDMEKKMEGLKRGADAFLNKPFNFKYLLVNIESLLKNRASIKEHYSNELLPDKHLSPQLSQLDKTFVREFTQLVEENIANQDFGVKDLCLQLGISRVQLYRKVKALLGYSVSDYIKEVRLKKAQHLLLDNNLTIAQIAYQVGFTSPAYFSTAFKARFDRSPSDFKSSKGQ